MNKPMVFPPSFPIGTRGGPGPGSYDLSATGDGPRFTMRRGRWKVEGGMSVLEARNMMCYMNIYIYIV